jgi:hypothetical protein
MSPVDISAKDGYKPALNQLNAFRCLLQRIEQPKHNQLVGGMVGALISVAIIAYIAAHGQKKLFSDDATWEMILGAIFVTTIVLGCVLLGAYACSQFGRAKAQECRAEILRRLGEDEKAHEVLDYLGNEMPYYRPLIKSLYNEYNEVS